MSAGFLFAVVLGGRVTVGKLTNSPGGADPGGGGGGGAGTLLASVNAGVCSIVAVNRRALVNGGF
jgi:hypothetical protein